MKHTVFLQNANAVIEWEITDLTRKEAETEAFEAARNANDGEMVFVVCANEIALGLRNILYFQTKMVI